MKMRLTVITLLIIACGVALFNCTNKSLNKASTEAAAQDSLGLERDVPANIVVIDDLDTGLKSGKVVVDTAKIDTSKIMIWGKTMSDGSLRRNANVFVLQDGNGAEYNIDFSTHLKNTIDLRKLEKYYALPALMNGDTVQMLVPRRYFIDVNAEEEIGMR